MKLTIDQANTFVELPLIGLRREYPNHLMHLLNSKEDIKGPRELHPVFYGCYDWHSAVHGYWLLVRCARMFPALPSLTRIDELFNEHFTKENIARETQYFLANGRASYERPYGWGWLLALAQELSLWNHPKAKMWRDVLQPLVEEIRNRFLNFLPVQSYAIRVGTHYNTAFALKLALDFARNCSDIKLENIIINASNRYYAEDADYPARIEPNGDDFLSGTLTEALLMSNIFKQADFINWFNRFLPDIKNLKNLLSPADVSDRSDPKIVHLDGLNLSRSWCMNHIAKSFPLDHPTRSLFIESALKHLNESLPHVTSGDFVGEHWLATFALLALQEN